MRYLFGPVLCVCVCVCVCVRRGRLYIVMQNACEVMLGRYGVHTRSHLSTDILCS